MNKQPVSSTLNSSDPFFVVVRAYIMCLRVCRSQKARGVSAMEETAGGVRVHLRGQGRRLPLEPAAGEESAKRREWDR